MEVSALNGKAHPQEHRVHDPYAMTRRLWPCVGVSLGGQVDNFFQHTSSDILSLMVRAITSHSVPFDSKAHRHDVRKTWERPVRGWRLVAKRRCLLSCIFNSNTNVRRYVFPLKFLFNGVVSTDCCTLNRALLKEKTFCTSRGKWLLMFSALSTGF